MPVSGVGTAVGLDTLERVESAGRGNRLAQQRLHVAGYLTDGARGAILYAHLEKYARCRQAPAVAGRQVGLPAR
jgi:hypothetical protein